MVEVKYVSENDKTFWYTIDKKLSESEFKLKTLDKRGYVICNDNKPIGIMRYNLFWDRIPFLNLIYLEESCRGKGYGRQALLFWENEMREYGYNMIMLSTQVNEEAQHLYRKLGYKDKGSLFLDNTPFEQPQELLMLKVL